jgi:hypothetical protein
MRLVLIISSSLRHVFELTAISVLPSMAPEVRNNSRNPSPAMVPPPPNPNSHSLSPPLEKCTPAVPIPSVPPGTHTPLDGTGASMSSSPAREASVNSARADVGRVVSVQPLPKSILVPPSLLSPPGEGNVSYELPHSSGEFRGKLTPNNHTLQPEHVPDEVRGVKRDKVKKD